jgi:hypothetical protein
MHQQIFRQARGTALIVAMAVVFILASMCTVLMNETLMRTRHVAVDLEDIRAFEAAEAGIDAAIGEINRCFLKRLVVGGVGVTSPDGRPVYIHDPSLKPGCIGTKNWKAPKSGDNGDDLLPAVKPSSGYVPRPTWQTIGVPISGTFVFHDPNIVPQILGDVSFFTYAIDWLYDGIDNDDRARSGLPSGPYAVTDSAGTVTNNDGTDKNFNGVMEDTEIDIGERNKYTVYSTGIHKGVQRNGATQEGRVVTIEVVVQAKDVDLPLIDTGPLQLQIAPR